MHGLVKINEATTLAIHALVVLDKNSPSSMSVSKIATLLVSSKDHLQKVMQALTHAGYVTSSRGPKGGFTLIKPANEIRLLEIYELLEGQLKIDDCLLHHKPCGGDMCVLGNAIRETNVKLKEFFDKTVISELTETFCID